MKILLITHYYAPEFGAPQRRWSALIRRFVAAGHQVTVSAPVPHYPRGLPTARERREHPIGAVERGEYGETVLRTAYLPHRADIISRTADHVVASADAACRLALRFQRRDHRPDVIVATAPAIPSLMVGSLLAAMWRVPLVAEMRDAWPDLVTHVGPSAAVPKELAHPPRPSTAKRALGLAVGIAKGQVHRAVTSWQRGAAEVVTTTQRFADVLQMRGIALAEVVRNGSDLSQVQLQHDHPAGDHEELRCLYLGNMGRSQGLQTVVRAAAQLHAEGVKLHVRMVGHGVEAGALADLAKDLGAPVSVHERIPHHSVVDEYAWADTVIVSLRDWEPFAWTIPSKLYELLAVGRHITALLAGEAADVVRESGAGDVLPPGDTDALVELWRQCAADRERVRVRSSSRDWVAAHADDDLLAERYLQILHKVVERGRSGRR